MTHLSISKSESSFLSENQSDYTFNVDADCQPHTMYIYAYINTYTNACICVHIYVDE